MARSKYGDGDWLRWMRNGALVIGVVQYVRDQFPAEPSIVYVTDIGEVAEGSVLEGRGVAASAAA